MKVWKSELDRVAQVCDPKYPVIATTFRVTEHWQAGAMTRNLTWQAEMMPEMFVEISPTLAKAKGIKAGDWVKVKSVRGEVMARADVTHRVAPFTCGKPGLAEHRGDGGPALALRVRRPDHRRSRPPAELRRQPAGPHGGGRQHHDPGIQGIPGGCAKGLRGRKGDCHE